VAVVLPDLKLVALLTVLNVVLNAVLLTTLTIRVSPVFRSTSPSTTAALLSSLTVVIQFSSLVVVTPCCRSPSLLSIDPDQPIHSSAINLNRPSD
jgi:hypothetical protein